MNTPEAAQRYLVQAGEPQQLQELLQLKDAGFTLVETIGPASAPHTAVVTMSAGQAEALARRFQKLTIEPDRPLSLFRDAGNAQVASKG